MRFGGLPAPASGVGAVSLRKADTVARRLDQALSWVSTTPLGAPVVPEVSSTNAGSDPPTTPVASEEVWVPGHSSSDASGIRGNGVTGTGTSVRQGSAGS